MNLKLVSPSICHSSSPSLLLHCSTSLIMSAKSEEWSDEEGQVHISDASSSSSEEVGKDGESAEEILLTKRDRFLPFSFIFSLSLPGSQFPSSLPSPHSTGTKPSLRMFKREFRRQWQRKGKKRQLHGRMRMSFLTFRILR